ncbi:MAG: aminotransferase class III-fold pyridoxal phosphate-dependent enzyme, partial [Bacteroidota bacterium]
EKGLVSGIIDFGDARYTETINELAIACAYAGQNAPDPLAATSEVVQAYHEIFPLQEAEVEVLPMLMIARLLITVAHSAKNKAEQPDNEYLTISEAPAWEALAHWSETPIDLIHYRFRQACGWEPCPQRSRFDGWLEAEKPTFFPVVPYHVQDSIHLDLSVGSTVLGNNSQFESITHFDRTIFRHLEDNGKTMGFGGYAEIRPFYTTDAYQKEGNNGPQWRTAHIGMDFWMTAGTPVFAPLDGIVHSFANNAADCDYGPTIILEHNHTKLLIVFTLYGHLSVDSLSGLQVGQTIKAGQEIARIGDYPVNGNWPAHLHFQVMLDTLEKTGDFPGVAYPHELKTWRSLCPDPRLLTPDLEYPVTAVQTLTEILAKRTQYLPSNLSISYDHPLHILRGYGPYLYAADGRRYLDTVNNVAHVGHEHPQVVQAAQRQIGLLNTNTRYLHPAITNYAEALLATLPDELEVVFFVNSGSEANE